MKKGETLPDTNEDVEKSETETALIAEQDNQEEKGTILTSNYWFVNWGTHVI